MESSNSHSDQNDIRFTWNILPSTQTDSQNLVIPPGIHVTPLANPEVPILEYEPLRCICGSLLSPLSFINTKTKVWDCPFCGKRNSFPRSYAEFISDENLPAEVLPENDFVEYRIRDKRKSPIFLFVIDVAVEEDELNEVKETIQQIVSDLPPDCRVGLITYGKICNVIEVGMTDYTVSYALNGEKSYKTADIQEILGLLIKNKNGEGTFVNPNSRPKFIMPVSEVSFFINSFLDDLSPDGWIRQPDTREKRCSGLAINAAISLLEAYGRQEIGRILLFLGGPGTIGDGKIVGIDLKETIRNYVDFEKGNENTKHTEKARKFYDEMANRASLDGITVDLFACCLNQVGLFEMQNMVFKTGGYMIFTDSFSTMIFKDSIKKMFEQDENGNLKMSFRGTITFNCSEPYLVSGALGHLNSLHKKSKCVSENLIGEGETNEWLTGSLSPTSTFSFLLDVSNSSQKKSNNSRNQKKPVFQFITRYLSWDGETRIRVATISRPLGDNHENGFDQEAAAVLIARMAVSKNRSGEEGKEIIKWVDRMLIRLMVKFAKYTKEKPNTFKLSEKFSYFPQFMFYLRRSSFIQNFNESPDESTYYKTLVMNESVSNCTIMIQPLLFEYTADEPNMKPVFLDLNSLKPTSVLLLDTFFYLVVWHGSDVAKWREEGFQDQEGYENVKQMLEDPVEYAQNVVLERLPTPRFVSCDAGSGQERLLKCIVNPSAEGKNSNQENGFFSDDVNLGVFMEYLKKLTVNS